MINLLAILYILGALMYFYSHKSGYSLLRYMYKRKNINILLSVEIIFMIITSFIVFTNQPLNWIVALIMLLHIAGIAWIVSNPENYYEMIEESLVGGEELAENIVVITQIVFAILVLYSKVIFTL